MQQKLSSAISAMICALTVSTGVSAGSCDRLDGQLVGLYDEPASISFSTMTPGALLKKGDVLAQEVLVVTNRGWRLQRAIQDSTGVQLFKQGDVVSSVYFQGERKFCALHRGAKAIYCFGDSDGDGTPETLLGRKATPGAHDAEVLEQPVEVTSIRDSLSAETKATELPIFSLIIGRRLVATKVKKKYVELAIEGGMEIVTMQTEGFSDINYYGKDHKTRAESSGAHVVQIEGFEVRIEDGVLVDVSGSFLSPQVTFDCDGRRLHFQESEIVGGIY